MFYYKSQRTRKAIFKTCRWKKSCQKLEEFNKGNSSSAGWTFTRKEKKNDLKEWLPGKTFSYLGAEGRKISLGSDEYLTKSYTLFLSTFSVLVKKEKKGRGPHKVQALSQQIQGGKGFQMGDVQRDEN